MSILRTRARNALLGLALGDAMSWPAMFQRSYALPFWTRRIRREIDAAEETTHAIRPAMPFSLNRSAEAFALCGTDDTEWAAFTAQQLVQQRGKLEASQLLHAWQALAKSEQPVRGSLSVQAALRNLRRGKMPPHTGHDHPHYFDDAAVARAVPIGAAYAGQPHAAAALAMNEAQITNAEDGVWAAQAMAAAMACACAGKSVEEVIAAAQSYLPHDSWIRRTVHEALTLCDEQKSLLENLPRLHEAVSNRVYSYGTAAPETFALTLAVYKLTHGDFEAAVFMANGFAKNADSVPAFVGALCGAMCDAENFFPAWRDGLKHLRGICIPALAGMDYLALVEQFTTLIEEQ